jgi:hypothetical protein
MIIYAQVGMDMQRFLRSERWDSIGMHHIHMEFKKRTFAKGNVCGETNDEGVVEKWTS